MPKVRKWLEGFSMVTSKWIIEGIFVEYETAARTLGSLLETSNRGTARIVVFTRLSSLSRRHLMANETSIVAVPRSSREIFLCESFELSFL